MRRATPMRAGVVRWEGALGGHAMNPRESEKGGTRAGVCSWSLQPTTPEALVSSVKACGLNAVQLALDPIREASGQGPWALDRTQATLTDAGITILSGMIGTIGEDYSTLESIRHTGGVRPDKHWQQNLHNARASAAIASALGVELVTLHAGFLPHDPQDPEFDVMLDRLAQVARAFAAARISIALETGQESADTLTTVLDRLADGWREPVEPPGVNFDPANMILYGMGDPVKSLRLLAPHVHQVHIKDALPASVPGTWGAEVPVGAGSVDWPAFFALLREHCPNASLIIEREAGTTRVEDVRRAVALIHQHALHSMP